MRCLQARRFRPQLIAYARVVFDALTALKSAHQNKDVQAAADEAIAAGLSEVYHSHL